ncbi:MAG: hypothetical protein H7840_15475 [Alphaproteobacteria bacterium]
MTDNPPRTPEERALIAEYPDKGRHASPPKVKADDTYGVDTDTNDQVLWVAQLLRTMGVDDAHLALNLYLQSKRSAQSRELDVNASLAAVDAIGPRDSIEAMLAVQMVATHNAAMTLLSRVAVQQPTIQVADSVVNRAGKLMRVFTEQVNTLTRYRTSGKQQVTVTHVNVTADRAAVAVGCGQPGGGVAPLENGGQPHALGHAQGATMLCTHAEGHALPIPGGEGKDPLPHARSRPRKRRAKG